MEQYNKQLTAYCEVLKRVSLRLQKEEELVSDKDDQANERGVRLNEKNAKLDMEEYALDDKFKEVLEQCGLFKLDFPELNKVKERRDKLHSKVKQYNLQKSFYKAKEKGMNEKASSLPNEKRKVYDIIRHKVFETYSSIDTNAAAREDEEVSQKDKNLIAQLVTKYKKMRQFNKQNSESTDKLSLTQHSKGSEKKRGQFVKLSKLNILHDYKDHQANQIGLRSKTLENIPHPNKSFYLLYNKRLKESVTNLAEITKEDIGGEFSCSCLLKTYQHNIEYTEKVRAKSTLSKPSSHRTAFESSHKEKRTIQKHKQGDISTTFKNGRVIQVDLISMAARSTC